MADKTDMCSYPIMRKVDCDKAIKKLSKEIYHIISTFSIIENENNSPKGCYFNTWDQLVYWNNNPFDDSTERARRICKNAGIQSYKYL